MFQPDLTNCDREPIHIPGRVQSHGFIVVTGEDDQITHVSANITAFTGIDATSMPGKKSSILDEVLGKKPTGFLSQLISLGQHPDGFRPNNPYRVTIAGNPWNLIINQSPDHYLFEFEPERTDLESELQHKVGRSLSEMLAYKELSELLNNVAVQIKKIIHYDRVMIYKFHNDGHGEVVAETKNEELEPWLGLHYPASDIPQQARELYKLNLVRLIADVHTEPAALLTHEEQPLDLTNSGLRAVSPIHIQYLKNMGVASSFSVSILDRDKLWGLIACHNYTPRFINFNQRESAKLVGQVLSSAISFRQQEEDQNLLSKSRESISTLTRSLLHGSSIPDALFAAEGELLKVVGATGAAFVFEKKTYTMGQVPGEKFLNELCEWLSIHVDDCYANSNLVAEYPAAKEQQDTVSGLLTCRLSKELNEFIIWFRPERIAYVNWAGNPEKPTSNTESGLMTISPRESFKVWSQEVHQHSLPWEPGDHAAANQLREEINFAISRRATELRVLNEKLREAYNELDTFSYTISHDLKHPLTTIKSYAQLIVRATDQERMRNMAGRINDGAVKMQAMIEEVLQYSRVGQARVERKAINMQHLLDELRHDLLIAFNQPEIQIEIGNAPELEGDQLMIQQVFSNLIGNAVKYSSKAEQPKVKVEGQRIGQKVMYTITDNGIGIDQKDFGKIFDLFSRADAGKEFEGSGVGLSIVKRIIEKHQGKIWLESERHQGTRFFVEFPLN